VEPPVAEIAPTPVAVNLPPEAESLRRSAQSSAPPNEIASRTKDDEREKAAARERAAATTAAGGAALGFTFSGESWVEVMDASGKKVLSRRFKAGDAEEVLGRAPFTVTIGNASSTRMAFNGREFALDPHTRGAVARVVVK
jgi:cytoskeleton protein RodZ